MDDLKGLPWGLWRSQVMSVSNDGKIGIYSHD